MTRDARIAFSEVVRLMALLTEAKTPHAKALAVVISERLINLSETDDSGDILPESEIAEWIRFARLLKVQDQAAAANASKKRRGTKSGSVIPFGEGAGTPRGSQKP
jgi:hypothetical protein